MKRKFVILPLLLFIGVTVMAQGVASRPYGGTYTGAANRSTLGIKTELSKKGRGTNTWFYGGPILSPTVSFTRRATRSSSSYASAGSYSGGYLSIPRISFSGSSRSASASHSTYTNNKSGKSVNSLGLTSSLTGKNEHYISASGSFATSASGNSPTKRFSAESREVNIGSRSIGSIKTVTSDMDGSSTYTPFEPGNFNDACPKDGAGPMGDAVVPMLLLLGLLVTYKKLK